MAKKRKKFRPFRALIVLIPLLFLIVISADLILESFEVSLRHHDRALGIAIVSGMTLLFVIIPLLLLVPKRKWRSFFLAVDFLFFAFIATFSFDWATRYLPNSLSVSASWELATVTLIGLAFLCLRLLEALLWRRKLSESFQRADLNWPETSKVGEYVRGSQWALFVMGALSMLLVLIFAPLSQPSTLPLIALGLLPLAFPWWSWMTSSLMGRAEQYGLVTMSMKDFRALRKRRLFIFHHGGVLTEGYPRVKEVWIDPEAEFTKEEIQDVLIEISQRSRHPIGSAVATHLGVSEAKLLQLDSFEEIQHLGARAHFKDVGHREGVAVFGRLTWHKILQNEIAPEGMRKLKDWQETGLDCAMLSINRSIVAALAIYDPLREDSEEGLRNLCRMKRHATVITALPEIREEVYSHLVDSALNVLPIERPSLLARWTERISDPVKIEAAWDPPQDQFLTVGLAPERSHCDSSRQLWIVGAGIPSLVWSIQESRSLQRKHILGLISIPFISCGILLLPSLVWTAVVFLLVYFFLILASALRSLERVRV